MRRLVFLSLCLPWTVAACSCVEMSQSAARQRAYAIFTGIVTDIHYFESEEVRKTASRTLVTFQVTESWKGPVGKEIQIHAQERALMCDSYTFRIGQRYLVYAIQQDKEGGWADQYPTGTKILSVGACILRIREDIHVEARKLGKSRGVAAN